MDQLPYDRKEALRRRQYLFFIFLVSTSPAGGHMAFSTKDALPKLETPRSHREKYVRFCEKLPISRYYLPALMRKRRVLRSKKRTEQLEDPKTPRFHLKSIRHGVRPTDTLTSITFCHAFAFLAPSYNVRILLPAHNSAFILNWERAF